MFDLRDRPTVAALREIWRDCLERMIAQVKTKNKRYPRRLSRPANNERFIAFVGRYEIHYRNPDGSMEVVRTREYQR